MTIADITLGIFTFFNSLNLAYGRYFWSWIGPPNCVIALPSIAD
jgi:hypothetical protein